MIGKTSLQWILLIGLTISLVGCGSHTQSITQLHHQPLQVDHRNRNPSHYETRTTLAFDLSYAQPDTSQERYETSDGELVPYEDSRLPINLNLQKNLLVEGFRYGIGMGTGEGLIANLSMNAFDVLQIHGFASSWVFGNHKYGLGTTIRPIQALILGYGLSTVNTYAIACTGTCGLGAFETVQDTKTTWRQIFETQFRQDSWGLFVKIETNREFDTEVGSLGVSYLF